MPTGGISWTSRSEALAPVLRDLGTYGAPVPHVRDKQWSNFPGQVTAMLHDTDGTAQGVFAMAAEPLPKGSLPSPTRSKNGPSKRSGVLADPRRGLNAPSIRTPIR
jgi:hypothetical protein